MDILKQIEYDMELLEQSDLISTDLDTILSKYANNISVKNKFEKALDECCIVNKETLFNMIHNFMFRIDVNPILKMNPQEITAMLKDLEDIFSDFYSYNYNKYAPKFSNITSIDVYKVLEVLQDMINE